MIKRAHACRTSERPYPTRVQCLIFQVAFHTLVANHVCLLWLNLSSEVAGPTCPHAIPNRGYGLPLFDVCGQRLRCLNACGRVTQQIQQLILTASCSDSFLCFCCAFWRFVLRCFRSMRICRHAKRMYINTHPIQKPAVAQQKSRTLSSCCAALQATAQLRDSADQALTSHPTKHGLIDAHAHAP